MHPDVQRSLVGEILALQSDRTTTMADDVRHIAATAYTSSEQARLERERWFAGQPFVACFSRAIPQSGDHLTLEVGGVPIAVARGTDGVVRAYENICRHRAAPVVRGEGRVARSFSCAFHGWVYDLDDGHLVGQPRSCDGFASVDGHGLGLRPLPVSERHGLVVVDPRRGAPPLLDVDGWLCGLADELATYGYDHLVPFRRATETWQCNWKLLLETFFESYHVFALHRESLGPLYTGLASPAHGFGPHNRVIVPMASILGLADQPPASWELLPHAVVQYFIAPDLIVSNLYGHVNTWRFVPRGPGATEVVHTLYTRGEVVDPDERESYHRRFESARAITGLEDYPESERVHRNLDSGRVAHTLIGRNEAGVHLFHDAVERALER
jgi:phenylpropionate dioxygenase-like ring-hydroxylating dioxygenase large terminal subunit